MPHEKAIVTDNVLWMSWIRLGVTAAPQHSLSFASMSSHSLVAVVKGL